MAETERKCISSGSALRGDDLMRLELEFYGGPETGLRIRIRETAGSDSLELTWPVDWGAMALNHYMDVGIVLYNSGTVTPPQAELHPPTGGVATPLELSPSFRITAPGFLLLVSQMPRGKYWTEDRALLTEWYWAPHTRAGHEGATIVFSTGCRRQRRDGSRLRTRSLQIRLGNRSDHATILVLDIGCEQCAIALEPNLLDSSLADTGFKRRGKAAAWIRSGSETLDVVDLQRSYHGNYYFINFESADRECRSLPPERCSSG